MEALRAAVENGADAVYLGGQAFNARSGAANFSREELQEAITYAHLRGVRVYVTVNILIANSELPELVDYLHFLYCSGADAVILQDLGVAYLVRHVLPELPVHASTQMTILNSPGVKLAQEMGFTRVVLARETSHRDMREIYRATGADLEVFIHGALCVCYSGQCLMSSMIGGRSGNRGRCAQPCRLTYQLVDLDGGAKAAGIEVGEHLLSPRDLNLLDYLGELAEAGISSLKVEGRMKRAEYVATVIRNYRQALDRLVQGEGKGSREEHAELAQIFNRDFTAGYLLERPGAELMSYKRPNNRGVMLGRVQKYDKAKDRVLIRLETELSLGDGIEVWVNKGREGVYVHRIWDWEGEVESAGPGQQVWLELPGPVSPGDRIFKTHDEKLVSRARLSYQEGKGGRRIPLDFFLAGRLGEPLRLSCLDADGNRGEGVTGAALEEAVKRPLTREYLVQQLDRLGNTPFALNNVELHLRGNLIVPVKEINEARRQAVEQVMAVRQGSSRVELTRKEVQRRFERIIGAGGHAVKRECLLAVSVGDMSALERAAGAGADIIHFGGDRFRSKPGIGREELARGIDYCRTRGVIPVIRLPRLVHEHRLQYLAGYLEKAMQAGAESVQVADLGSLAVVRDYPGLTVYGDYTLNAFNDPALLALESQGVKLAALSPELSLAQLEALKLRRSHAFELVVHGALPLMISEYCAVGSLLGGGKPEGCTRPCQRKTFGLKDRMNFVFPVETDQECRMHIFNVKELNLIEHLAQILRLGPAAVRLELKREDPGYVAAVTKIYRREIDYFLTHPAGYEPQPENVAALMGLRPGGFTKGHYFRGVV